MFYHLKLQGNDPHQWGIQHGETLKKQIQELNLIRLHLLKGFLKTWSQEEITKLCLEHAETLKNRYPELYQECLGISKASGVSLEHLMALNAYTDLRDFSASSPARTEDGCSLVALKNKKSNYAAQTWDMHGSATPYMLLLEFEKPNPTRVLTVTGCLGLAGVNHHGLSVMINNMHCRETSRNGLVWPGLVRLMLQQKSALEAQKILSKNIPSSGHNYLLFDEQTALNIETTGKQWELTHSLTPANESGFIFHTNHYVGKLKEFEILERQSPSTHKRYQALEQLCSTEASLHMETQSLQKNLFMEGKICDEICIPLSEKDPHAGATCGGLEVDHKTRKARAFQGMYNDQKFIEWTF